MVVVIFNPKDALPIFLNDIVIKNNNAFLLCSVDEVYLYPLMFCVLAVKTIFLLSVNAKLQ